MSKFLTSSFFVNFVIPLAVVMFSVFIKAVCRDDSQPTFKKEDLSVGFELSLASIFAFTTYSVSIAHRAATIEEATAKQLLETKFTSIPWLLVAWLVGLWGLTFLMRKLGWQINSANPTAKEPTWFIGIIVPFIFGLVSLIFVVNWVE
jgi:uncharacterized membrane protein YgcG